MFRFLKLANIYLKLQKGDEINIISKNASGLWKGCVDGRVGNFKFILVEELTSRHAPRQRHPQRYHPRKTSRSRTRTLEELLTRLNLPHLVQV